MNQNAVFCTRVQKMSAICSFFLRETVALRSKVPQWSKVRSGKTYGWYHIPLGKGYGFSRRHCFSAADVISSGVRVKVLQ